MSIVDSGKRKKKRKQGGRDTRYTHPKRERERRWTLSYTNCDHISNRPRILVSECMYMRRYIYVCKTSPRYMHRSVNSSVGAYVCMYVLSN